MALSQQEEARRSLLNAGRYRKPSFQQEFRKNLFKQNNSASDEPGEADESTHKSRLSLLKANAVKMANREAGGYVGGLAGGAAGSVVPVIGTGIGAFLGRFFGRKLGVTGIILLSLFIQFVLLLTLIIATIATLYFACQTPVGKNINTALWMQSFGAIDICTQLK